MLNKDEIAELKASVNIVDVISQYVALTKAGKSYLGLCPFHGEKTPSFNVNAEKGFFHCFGCGKSGDAIGFLQEYKQVRFVDAVKELADFAGVQLNIDNERPVAENPNAKLFEINNQAARLYNMVLTTTALGQKAQAYLAERGISAEIIKTFNLGLAPEDNDFLYQNLSSKFDDETMAKSGLFNFSSQNVYDFFSNRIMFPVTNEFGHTIAFSGRKWQENDTSKAKYINTSATEIFEKSYEFFHLDKAKASIKKTKEVYLMEGPMDVIAAHKAGIFNVVATMGTALTEKHEKRLRSLAKKYILIYDGDNAGQNAIFKAIDLLGQSKSEIVRIPEGLDPDEYGKTYSYEALAKLMTEGRIQPIEFLMDYRRPSNLSNTQAQVDFLEEMAAEIVKVSSLTAQDLYVRKLVELLPDFDYNQVEQNVNLRRENVQTQAVNVLPEDYPEPYFPDNVEEMGYYEPVQQQTFQAPVQKRLSKVERSEEQLLGRMLTHAELLMKFSDDENFRFIHQHYQDLFDKLLIEYMTYEELNLDHFAGELSEENRGLFYEILAKDYPEEVSEQEIQDIMATFGKTGEESKYQELQNQLDLAKKSGNEKRELELTLQMINQKKKLL